MAGSALTSTLLRKAPYRTVGCLMLEAVPWENPTYGILGRAAGKAFVRKWRLKCRAVADSLAEAGDKLFTFTRLSKSQWKSARTTNAIERLNEEFKRRIKTQTVLPCPETVPMLLWALLASGQIQMRKVDGWETLDQLIADETLDRAA